MDNPVQTEKEYMLSLADNMLTTEAKIDSTLNGLSTTLFNLKVRSNIAEESGNFQLYQEIEECKKKIVGLRLFKNRLSIAKGDVWYMVRNDLYKTYPDLISQ